VIQKIFSSRLGRAGCHAFLSTALLLNTPIAFGSKAQALKSNQKVMADQEQGPCFARFVPERKGDFAWENDKVAFRMYGPEAKKGKEDSGIDCWLKRVDYPIINKWYRENKEGKSYHVDHGEGHDPYHVGSSRGSGGLGLWIDGQLLTSNVFRDYEVIRNSGAFCHFKLSYRWEVNGDKYEEIKEITLKAGEQLFSSVSTFKKNGQIAPHLPIAIGLTTHEGKANVYKNLKEGWIACWEVIKGYGLGTGVWISPERIDKIELIKSKKPDHSHVLIITKTNSKGQVSYKAGYGWEKAGEILNIEDWQRVLGKN
jgi:hypothetical protein